MTSIIKNIFQIQWHTMLFSTLEKQFQVSSVIYYNCSSFCEYVYNRFCYFEHISYVSIDSISFLLQNHSRQKKKKTDRIHSHQFEIYLTQFFVSILTRFTCFVSEHKISFIMWQNKLWWKTFLFVFYSLNYWRCW